MRSPQAPDSRSRGNTSTTIGTPGSIVPEPSSCGSAPWPAGAITSMSCGTQPWSMNARRARVRSSSTDRSPSRRPVADDGHRRLGRAHAAPDAGELGRRLPTPSQVEQLRVDLQPDAAGAQLVGDREREVARHDRLLQAGVPARADDALAERVVEGRAAGQHLLQPELLEGQHLVAAERPHARRVERPREDPALAAALEVGERIRQRQRNLVAQRVAARVAVDEDVGHAPPFRRRGASATS